MKWSLRHTITMLVIGAYLIFSYGFMLIRIPPVAGGGIPIGEILLLFSLSFLIKDLKWVPLFTNNIIFIAFLMWWTLGISRVLLALPEYGMWAFRDATHVIESLFLWVGFVFASSPSAIDRLFLWLKRILTLGCLNALTFPFREIIQVISPTITAASGYTAFLFPHYTLSGVILLWEAIRRLIDQTRVNLLISGLLLAYAVAIFQARTIYIQVLAILLLMLWYRPKIFGKMSLAIGAGLFALILVIVSGVEIKGRIGQNISFEFIGNHFTAIAGIENTGVEGAAKGVDLRLNWWKDILNKLIESPEKLLLGLGYGFPLMDFHGIMGNAAREPHNSFISILGRIGILGAIFFTWMHIHLMRAWLKAYYLCRKKRYFLGQDRLFMFLAYFVLVWVYSLGEDAFEKPFITIPYYFFWGVFLHYRLHLKNSLLTNIKEN